MCIYGKLKKRKSSSPSRGKSLRQSNTCQRRSGLCNLCIEEKVEISHSKAKPSTQLNRRIWSVNLPSRESTYVYRSYIETYKNLIQPSSAPVWRSSSSSAFVKHSVTTCGSKCSYYYVYISIYVYSTRVCIIYPRWFKDDIYQWELLHYIIESTVDNNEERKTLSNNMSRLKVHMKARQRSEFKIWKLIRTKIQVLPTGTRSLVGKASALEKPRTRVRVQASVRFFICSVESFLLCCPCEALEGPISTRVYII